MQDAFPLKWLGRPYYTESNPYGEHQPVFCFVSATFHCRSRHRCCRRRRRRRRIAAYV